MLRGPIQIILSVFTQELNPRAIEYTLITLVLYKIHTALKFYVDSIILTNILRENLHVILQETRKKLPKYEYLLAKMFQIYVLEKNQAHILHTLHFFRNF